MDLLIDRKQICNILLYLAVLLGFLSYEYTIYRSAYQAILIAVFSLGGLILFLGITENKTALYFYETVKKNMLVYLLSISMLLSTLVSSLKLGLVTYNSILSVTLTIMTFYIFFLFIPILLGKDIDKKIKRLCFIITIFSVIGIIIGVNGSFLGYTPTHFPRVSSVFFDPNYFGTLCALGFILNINMKGKYKVFALLNIISLYFSGSRAAMISLFIVILIFFFYKKKLKIKTIVSFVSLCLVGYVSLYMLFEAGYFRLYNGLSSRDYLWELSFKLIKDQPIWGYGHGAVDEVLQNLGASIGSSHNAYLDFIIVYGLPTFLLYCMVIMKALYLGAKNNIPQYVLQSTLLLLITANSISINLGGLGLTSLLFTLFLGICNAIEHN
ncbi:O-antigen ligase family protein [Sporosarcina luteola]|uniref:O-antigen ligase family protein n=1 Tax=Sporosarcina luteola TaxID=582850 RepID=UPI00203EDC45|nr:O-antigen ligase family protein [Sporosarcina luteola]MCM3711637.1 O-antigen ligase family protein [Sporosarcina luteola]